MHVLNPTLWLSLTLLAINQSVPAAESAQSALQREPAGWLDIQPAQDLKGWTRVAIPPTNALGRAQWHVDAQGLLICDGDGGHEMLRYDRELGDCIFHVEFRFVPVIGTKSNYNSGVFIRNSAQGEIWHQAQLTMDGGYLFGRTLANGQPQRIKLNPTERRMKPAGEWNTIECICAGDTITNVLNGTLVNKATNVNPRKGKLLFQSEGAEILFRKIELKPVGK